MPPRVRCATLGYAKQPLRGKEPSSSEIELAVLLGRHVARRGFWGAQACRPRNGWAIAEAVDAWEQASARPRIAVWCRLGIFADEQDTEPGTIPAQKLEGSG